MVAVAGGGWKGNRGTFPVEMGLSLHQLLLQLLQKPGKKACRHTDGHILIHHAILILLHIQDESIQLSDLLYLKFRP